MGELILPPSVRANHRPYRTANTAALLYELQQRQVVAELAGQIMQPQSPLLDEAATAALRTEQFRKMAQDMGVAIAGSQFALCAVTQQPNLVNPEEQDELLIMKVMLVRHPQARGQPPVLPTQTLDDLNT